jgi:uncharacterized membrane protein SpoIIM required for sporulation
MRQEEFEARFAKRWDEFSRWLVAASQRQSSRGTAPVIDAAEIPARYREICQHLALARDREYSAELVERLSRLALSGHQMLYGAHGRALSRIGAFVARDFPAAVRARLPFVLLSAVLFFGPLVVLAGALQRHPDFAYVVLPSHLIDEFESMYGEDATKLGRARDADDDAVMFGFYIWNNIRIGFQTFAGGIAFGLGALFYLVFNGVFSGAVAGYLIHAGLGESFFSFVSGHSSFELIAVVLCGAAGLRLGYALIAPGRKRRTDALRAAALEAIPLVVGAAGMLLVAAGIEAFWSPRTAVPPPVKYAVGGALWLMLLAYFAFAGRRRAA